MCDNINGPSLIRMPDWAPGLGKYHLYFSDHKGRYIRLAYADDLTGPWTMHEPGALDISDSLFPTKDPPEPPEELRPPWAKKMRGGYLYAHIASPDVHIDHGARRIRMYFHGLVEHGNQLTRLADSADGVTFKANGPPLGPPYFRCFHHGSHIYAIAWAGDLWRSKAWGEPFEQGPNLVHFHPRDGVGEGMRHGEARLIDGRLHLFYTRFRDTPERILHATVDLTDDWMNWTASEPTDLLAPELDWEGADLPLEPSVMGAAIGRQRELRDPCYFEDADGARYLLYCGAAESGIGIARLDGF
ncbi:MAG: hypothetical protein AAF401_11255 [Pseudomonadota bacterium]